MPQILGLAMIVLGAFQDPAIPAKAADRPSSPASDPAKSAPANIAFKGEKAPEALVLDKVRGLPKISIIIAEGAPARSRWVKDAVPVGKLKFLSTYYEADSATGDDGITYLLLATNKGGRPETFVGWVAADQVLQRISALMDKPGIYTKGRIKNDFKISRRLDEVGISGADVLDGPGERADDSKFTKLLELRLADIHYVYARAQSPKGNMYTLLGRYPQISDPTRAEGFLLGWVPAERVMEWNTRYAIEFDKRTFEQRLDAAPAEIVEEGKPSRDSKKGARIFAKSEEAEGFGRQELGPDGKPIAEVSYEDATVKSWSYFSPRFPLLSSRTPNGVAGLGNLVEVGYVGDRIFADGHKIMTVEQQAENDKRLREMLLSLSNIDILFVIDSTGSMGRYLTAAADGVRTITKDVLAAFPADAKRRPSIRFSTLLYRDYVDQNGINNPQVGDPADTYLVRRVPLTSNEETLSSFLEVEARNVDGGGDALEAMYCGIDEAVTSSLGEVRPQGLRVVVLIGDCGNHDPDPRQYTAEKIAAKLKEHNFRFFSIHVVSEADTQRNPAFKLFRQQSQAIRNELGGLGINPQIIGNNDPKRVAGEIVRTFEEMMNIAEKVGDAGSTLVGGYTLLETKDRYGVTVTDQLVRQMKQVNVDPNLYIQKSVQIFNRGWMLEKDPLTKLDQLRYVLLVDEPSLEQLQGILAGLASQTVTPDSVVRVWGQVLREAIGQVNLNQPISELIEVHTGIPIRNKLLSKSVEDLKNLTPEELAKISATLKVDQARIRGILKDKDFRISTSEKDGLIKVHVEDMGSRVVLYDPEYYRTGGKEAGILKIGWVPVDELP